MHIFGKLMPNAEVAQMLFEHAPVAMLLIDAVGHIHHMNGSAERLFGYAKSELVGRSMEVLVPEVVQQKHKRLREDFFQSPSSRPMGKGRRLSARRKDGHTRSPRSPTVVGRTSSRNPQSPRKARNPGLRGSQSRNDWRQSCARHSLVDG